MGSAMRTFDNVRGTLAESMAVLKRRDLLIQKIRRAHLSVPEYTHESNDVLYVFVKNLYYATFASIVAMFASTLPYLYVSDCTHAILANSLERVIVSTLFLYFYGFVFLTVLFWLPIFLNAIAQLVLGMLPLRRGLQWRGILTLNLADDTARMLKPPMALFALACWVGITISLLPAFNSDTSDEKLVRNLLEAEKRCTAITKEINAQSPTQ